MKKVVCFLACTLLIVAIALPAAGNNKEILNKNYDLITNKTIISLEKIKISNFFAGEIDLAVTLANPGIVSIFKGDGTGGFSYYGNTSVGSFPLGLTGGDFNKDSYYDLVASNYDNDTVTVLLGDGTGSFTSSGDYATGAFPFNIVTDDFNEDTNPDIAVVNMLDDTVSVLLGDGAGGLGTQQIYAVGNGPTALTAGDFNKDDNIDLIVVGESDNTISVLVGNGAGGFTLFGTHYLGGGFFSYSIQKADFNNDQNLDVVVGSGGYPCVGVLLGDGVGSFGPIQNFTTGVGGERFTIVTDDFNKDGNADIAIPNTNDDTISVLLGDGTGGFGIHQTYSVGDYPVCITSADFNSDGNSDLAITNAFIGTVSIYLGDGAGGFGSQYVFSAGDVPVGIVAADFDFIPEPDLDCDGALTWTEVDPGATVTGEFYVGNIGSSGSTLYWAIDEWPDWGNWTFTPTNGTLGSGDWETVQVTVVAPDQYNTPFSGIVKVVNIDDNSDFCNIDVSLETPLNNQQSSQQNIFQMFFQILQQILNIR